MKKIILITLLCSSFSLFSQLKVGSNATTISSLNNIEIEASNSKKVFVNKADGRTYIENKPNALISDSVVMTASDGEIRQMSLIRLYDGLDFDGDGIPNGTDPDDDGDGITDSLDKCPLQYGCASTPANGTTHGCPVNCFKDYSTNGTATITSFDNCSFASTGTMTQGIAVSGVSQTIQVTVSKAGTYTISTTNNGVTFSGTGSLSLGTQYIILTASGTPTAPGSYVYTLNTTPNCNFSRTVVSSATIALSSIGQNTNSEPFTTTIVTPSASFTYNNWNVTCANTLANVGNMLRFNTQNSGTTQSNCYTRLTSRVGTFNSVSFNFADYDLPGYVYFYDVNNSLIKSDLITSGCQSCPAKSGSYSSGGLSRPALFMEFGYYSDLNYIDDLTTTYTTGSSPILSGGTTNYRYPVVSGTISRTLNTGESVAIYRNNTYVGNAAVSGTSWSYTENNIPIGTYSYTAYIVYNSVNIATSNSYSIIVQ